MKYIHEYGVELESLLKKISKDKSLFHEFLFDLLSPAEYKEIAVRWQIVKLLGDGVSHREIAERLNISVATVTRGSRELMNKKGGFRLALNKYHRK